MILRGYVLDRVRDPTVISLIERISEHYKTNISNRYLRPLLLQLQIDKGTWDQIELITEKMELYRYQGFHIDDLYRQIAACAVLVQTAKSYVIPSLRNKLNSGPAGPDKVMRDMAANNFASNLHLFADLLLELYNNLAVLDRNDSGGKDPVYTRIPEISCIELQLAWK